MVEPFLKPSPDRPSKKNLSGSSILDRYLNELESLKSSFALEALTKPNQRDAFEFGRVSGVVEGLARAEQLLLDAKTESDDEKK